MLELRRRENEKPLSEAGAGCGIARLEKSASVRLIHEKPALSEMFSIHPLARTIRVEADLADQRSAIQFRREMAGQECSCYWRIST